MKMNYEKLGFLYNTIIIFLVCTVQPTTSNEEICGVAKVKNVNGLNRIVNGLESKPGEWPWQALILQSTNRGLYAFCGGTLLNERYVLTAAHCFESVKSDLIIWLGTTNRGVKELTRKQSRVKSVVCHESYNENDNTFVNDICVLQLESSVTFTDYILPACLPVPGTSVVTGEICTVTGWGETQGTADTSILQKADVEIISKDLCTQWYSESNIEISSDHFCAGFEKGQVDTCKGDSGGPLVCFEVTENNRKAYVVRGITSFGLGCARPRRPGVYTNVSQYVSWIRTSFVNNTLNFSDKILYSKKLLYIVLVIIQYFQL